MEKGHPLNLNNQVIKIPDEIWIKWSPPHPGKFKMNIDGASFGNLGTGGLGCVQRNHLAGFHLNIALPILHCSSLFAEQSYLQILKWVFSEAKRDWYKLGSPVVQWVYREANNVADELAKFTVGQAKDPNWINLPIFHRQSVPDELYFINLGCASIKGGVCNNRERKEKDTSYKRQTLVKGG
ncbi:hypothetical protein FRX31_032999 [Thalictrum thalictroides]|uniref:Uncharacterized protein n=1 Tax=Thalictrum thalictroides TaxID=46969 RepID=A0A7J6UXV6_THATH|nr:hypothetical protein FRX31_032999 [Thalictrum thalictroides]